MATGQGTSKSPQPAGQTMMASPWSASQAYGQPQSMMEPTTGAWWRQSLETPEPTPQPAPAAPQSTWRQAAMPFGMLMPQVAASLPGQLNPQTLPGMVQQQQAAVAPPAAAPPPPAAAPAVSVTPAIPDAYTYQGGHQVPTTPGAPRQTGEVLQPGDMASVPMAERHLYYFDPETYTYIRGRQ